ncbi:MAG: hypothetical protein GY953_30720, partial [bacterium]|nr:hypothetical protein [bacterium]
MVRIYAYDSEDPRSLRDNYATYAFLEDRAGNLWVGSYGGLNLLDPDSGGFVHTTASPRHSLQPTSPARGWSARV